MVPGRPADYWDEEETWAEESEQISKVIRFFEDEGAAALLLPSSREKGVVRVTYSGIERPAENAPTLVVARESFNMLARLVERGFEPKVRLESRVEIVEDVKGYNVIADIPGSDPELRDEVVILSGHLDAWHAGTGATNACQVGAPVGASDSAAPQVNWPCRNRHCLTSSGRLRVARLVWSRFSSTRKWLSIERESR